MPNKPFRAFKMQLKQGCLVEYKKAHDEIWPELIELLKQYGFENYQIYLDEETYTLFAVCQTPTDFDGDALARDPIMQRWWAMMAPIMKTKEGTAEPWAEDLPCMFFLK